MIREEIEALFLKVRSLMETQETARQLALEGCELLPLDTMAARFGWMPRRLRSLCGALSVPIYPVAKEEFLSPQVLCDAIVKGAQQHQSTKVGPYSRENPPFKPGRR